MTACHKTGSLPYIFVLLIFLLAMFTSVAEYLSAEGKTKVNMMFTSNGGQPCVEITKCVIKVGQKSIINLV